MQEGASIPVMSAANTELRDGINACRLDRSHAHPVSAMQQGVRPEPRPPSNPPESPIPVNISDAAPASQTFGKQFEAKTQEVSALYGSHMGMRMKMEAAILSRSRPFLILLPPPPFAFAPFLTVLLFFS